MISLPLAMLVFGLSLAGSLVTTFLLIWLARWAPPVWNRLLGARHGSPPRLGGISILAGFSAGVGLPLWLSAYRGNLFGPARYHWIGWIAAAVILFLWGLLDDLRGLSPVSKLIVQTAGAFVIYAAGFRVGFITVPGGGIVDLGWMSLPLTVLWIVGVVNAFNLIDGLDGLATGVALLSAGTVAAISFIQGVFPVTVIALALAGSLIGFLKYNFSPAAIYLGDSGSQFLGFTLAVISIRGMQKSATTIAILGSILILGLPLLDMLLVVVRRGWRIRVEEESEWRSPRAFARWGRILQRDREHIHYNLLDLGLSDRSAALLLYLAAGLFCLAAIALVLLRNPGLMLVVAACTALVTAGVKLAAVWKKPGQEATLPSLSEGTGEVPPVSVTVGRAR